MADLKISQLSDGGASQAADEYVVARSGNNFRIDGASVAAAATSVGTLTSLTVSGDLTVDTDTLKVDSANNRVGIQTASPAYPLQVRRAGGAGSLGISIDGVGSIARVAQYFAIGDATSATTGHAFYTRNTTATDNLAVMIDNTGRVGIGTASPSNTLSVAGKFGVNFTSAIAGHIAAESGSTFALQLSTNDFVSSVSGTRLLFGFGAASGNTTVNLLADYNGGLTPADVVLSTGNLGLGVTPSAWASASKALQLPNGVSFVNTGSNVGYIGQNWLLDSGGNKYIANGTAALYAIGAGRHEWYNAPSGTAGNAITFTQAMTLDASSNLALLGSFTIGNAGVSSGVINSADSMFFNIDSDNSDPTNANVFAWGKDASNTASTRLMTLDASGNLGVGATSPDIWSFGGTGRYLTHQATNAGGFALVQIVSEGTAGGGLGFGNATIRRAAVEGANGSHLVFYTNGSNSGTSVTERARITSGGEFLVGTTSYDSSIAGTGIGGNGFIYSTRSSGTVYSANRLTTDGTLFAFSQDGTEEGTISVSGNTVSYNAFAGSHWSQLEDGSKPDILRGTVIEAIDELCEWPGETNERLPKCKVSDTAGSKKVYGVFMDWDNDWTETNDMYVTAVGAFVCRISADVTVEQGDLLESNGDGTARVQADDVIRSSTIGKVTSTVQTHQYEDGTYCVPVVLYCG